MIRDISVVEMRYQVEHAHPVALQEAEHDLEDDYFEDGYNDALPERVAYLFGIERVITNHSWGYVCTSFRSPWRSSIQE